MENNITPEILEKWKPLIDACKAYYVDCVPTGLSDQEYDRMEAEAWDWDSFSARDYVLQTYLPSGTKTMNKNVDKIKKTKVEGKTMLQAMEDIAASYYPDPIYLNLKYDGTSLALYLDPSTGRPQ